MAKKRGYEDLIVYQRAYQLCLKVYRATEAFPSEERFGIISQMRRCAVSLSLNIAEGHRRGGKRGFAQFLRISLGSLGELETLLHLSLDLGFGDSKTLGSLFDELQELAGMLTNLIRALTRNATQSSQASELATRNP